MNQDFKSFGEIANGMSRSPLGIIALFIVLVYGVAALVTTFAGSLNALEKLPLIYFLVFFPVLVLVAFVWLIIKHTPKLYSPSDFKNEENYIRMQLSVATSLSAAVAKSPEPNVGVMDIDIIADSAANMVIMGSKSFSSFRSVSQKKILWVDDLPDDNIYVRKAFEAVGFTCLLARSTDEALELLKNNKFEAIISDMQRPEGPREGYVLLEKVRKQENNTPFFIYRYKNLPEHKKEAESKGAQGSTNNANELFGYVIKVIS